MKKKTCGAKKMLAVAFRSDPGKEGFIAGPFNEWEPGTTKLAETAPGSYAVNLRLPAGRYEYKFVVDDEWCLDPLNPETVPNDFGTQNNVLVVG